MTPMMFFILACLSTQINAYNNKNLMIGFDHLGLESLGLTSAEQELSDLAENIVTIQNRELRLENMEIFQNNIVVEQKTELPHHATSSHTIVKRGTESLAAAPPDNNSGYLALPIPPLPPGISKESTRLFRKPNSKLIELANNLAQKRRRHPSEFSLISGQQDILPPATNQIFELDDEPVVDPFRLTVNGHENYPNSIQDVLYTNDRPTDPPKQVIYKIVTKTPPPPPSNDSGTTKKIVYKLVTKPPPADSLPVVPVINTPKPEVIFHTRPPETIPAIVQTKPNQIPNSKKPAKNNGNQGSSHLVPGSKPALSPPKDENYYAVIPYDDITKLFELLNKHTKPMKADHPVPKKKSNSTPKPKKSHPTKKLQPKVIKRTPLGYKKKKHKKKKKKKKKVVHVSFEMLKSASCTFKFLKVLVFFQKCASSNSGIFAFFAFITLNINVTIDFMFSLMVTIMITGNLGASEFFLIYPNFNQITYQPLLSHRQ